MKMLNERVIGRLKQDILRMESEITNIKDRKSTLAVRQKKDKIHTKSIHVKVES